MEEFEVSRRTVAWDPDYLPDEENAPLAYHVVRHGYVLTDETYALPPVKFFRCKRPHYPFSADRLRR